MMRPGVDDVSRFDRRRFFEPDHVPPGDVHTYLTVDPRDDGLGLRDHSWDKPARS